jgi:hypothetical protein
MAMKCHDTIVMGIVSIPAHPLTHVTLKIMHQLSRRSSKLANFSEKATQIHDGDATLDLYIADSSMCIEHIINPAQLQIKITRRLKIEGCMKSIRRIQSMKSDFNRCV